METRLHITLNAQDHRALAELANKELLEMRQQVLQLVRDGLAKQNEPNGEAEEED